MEDVTTWGQLVFYIASGLVAILLATLRKGAAMAIEAWASRQTEEASASRIRRLGGIVDDGLATVEQNIIGELKKDVRAALADGVIDEAERKELRAKIVTYSRKTLDTEGLNAAKEVYGLTEETIDDWLANRVEGRLFDAVRFEAKHSAE